LKKNVFGFPSRLIESNVDFEQESKGEFRNFFSFLKHMKCKENRLVGLGLGLDNNDDSSDRLTN